MQPGLFGKLYKNLGKMWLKCTRIFFETSFSKCGLFGRTFRLSFFNAQFQMKFISTIKAIWISSQNKNRPGFCYPQVRGLPHQDPSSSQWGLLKVRIKKISKNAQLSYYNFDCFEDSKMIVEYHPRLMTEPKVLCKPHYGNSHLEMVLWKWIAPH